MLGDFIIRVLILLLGYAYPAFECFKTVEKNKAEIHDFRVWCQYWIILALFTVLERVGDILVSWLPLYGEIKVAFLVYLWYSKTKGIEYLYETLLRPYVAEHESEIDRNISEMRTRGLDLLIWLWQTGSWLSLRFAEQLADQYSKISVSTIQKDDPKSTRLSICRWSVSKILPATPPLSHSGNPNNCVQEETFYRQTDGDVDIKKEAVLDRDNVTASPNSWSIFRFRRKRQ